MSNLVSLETPGPFGAAVRLICNSTLYSEHGIREEADHLEYNYTRATGDRPIRKQEFLSFVQRQKESGVPIHPTDVVGSQFFQSMSSKITVGYHNHVASYIVPEMLKKQAGDVNNISLAMADRTVNDWLARFVETFISKKEIMRSYNFQGGIISDPAVEREKISQKILQCVKEKRLTTGDFESIIQGCQKSVVYMNVREENLPERLKFLGWYLTLFAMGPEHARRILSSVRHLKGELFKGDLLDSTHIRSGSSIPEVPSPFGPAARIVYNAKHYTANGLERECELLERNFFARTGRLLYGREEFCEYVRQQNKLGEPIHPIDVVNSPYFQMMIHERPPAFQHDQVFSYIVPAMLEGNSEIVANAGEGGRDERVTNWMAMFIETIYTEEQINRAIKFQGGVMPDQRVVAEKISKNLTDSVQRKALTLLDVELIMKVAENTLNDLGYQADHYAERLKFTGWYITLFGMDQDDPCALSMDVIRNLNALKAKLFSHHPMQLPNPPYARPLVARAPPMPDDGHNMSAL